MEEDKANASQVFLEVQIKAIAAMVEGLLEEVLKITQVHHNLRMS